MRAATGALSVAATLLVAACRPDPVAWRNHLASPEVARLAGAWVMELRSDPAVDSPDTARVRARGSLAITLNREHIATSLLGMHPDAFGTYDLRLDTLGVTTGRVDGTPDLWVVSQGDTLQISLSPDAKWPVTLVGFWHGDSITGRWRTDQRAGPGGQGDFTLWRGRLR